MFKKYLAEFIATFTLIFVGAGSILAGADLVGVALAHGLAILTMVYAIGHVSGAHINPAVTIGAWITHKIKSKDAGLYIVSQLLGATVAAFFLTILFVNAGTIGGPALGLGITLEQAILAEAIASFFLVFVIFGVAIDKKGQSSAAGLAIGFVILMDILVIGGLTGGAMNPARAFGPALVSGVWLNQIVYWIGPIVGGALGALTYNKIME